MRAPLAHTERMRPALCPELELHLLDRHSALSPAIKQQGLYAVHEAFQGLAFPPYWAYAFASGQALARYVIDHPVVVSGRSVPDVGASSGIAAISAARSGARWVVAIDRDPVAIEAVRANGALNHVHIEGRIVDGLMFDPRGFEALLASDVFYGDDQLLRRHAQWAELRTHPLVLVADPGRGFVPPDLVVEVERYSARIVPDLEFPDTPVVYTSAARLAEAVLTTAWTREGETRPSTAGA